MVQNCQYLYYGIMVIAIVLYVEKSISDATGKGEK